VIRCRSVSGSRRKRPSIQASLVAVLLGAAVAGSASVASRLSNNQPQVLDASPDQPPALMVTADHLGPTPLGDTVSSTPTTTTTTSTTTAPTSTTTPPSAPVTSTTSSTPHDSPVTDVPPPNPAGDQRALLIGYINAIRQQAGCQALREDPRLDGSAQQQSQAMADNGYYPSRDGAVNTAKGDTTAQQVINRWMQSRRSAGNVVNCGYGTIGVGLVTDGWYWTADFGR
jgi:uncharacterized protein YkwD